MRSYPADIIPPSGIIGDSIKIRARKIVISPPKKYENCDKKFYVIRTSRNTTVEILSKVTNNCIYFNEENKEDMPYYIQKQKNKSITGESFLIESLDKIISKKDKYLKSKGSGTHNAQFVTTKDYTQCILIQPKDATLNSANYDELVAIKEEKKKATGLIQIENVDSE